MEKEIINKLEKKAIELFGPEAVCSYSQSRLRDIGYNTRLKVIGLPFEISVYDKTREAADEIAWKSFNENLQIALEDSLFGTQKEDKYVYEELTTEEFERLFKHSEEYEIFGLKYFDEIIPKTTLKSCPMQGKYREYVLQSPFKFINMRCKATCKKAALLLFLLKIVHYINGSLAITDNLRN